jgi:hypothetical protein
MKRAIRRGSMILWLLLCTLPGQTLSQTPGPQSLNDSQRQQVQQQLQQHQQQAAEQRRQTMERQEEFWRGVGEKERQRLQDDWPNLSEEEKQRRQESLERSEERRQEMMQRQREFWQRTEEQEKQLPQRMEEQRRQNEEKQRAIKKAADEYSDEVWQDALGATPEQWKAIKPRLEKIHQLQDRPRADVSIYWISGSTSYRVQSLVESAEGTRSIAKASGWFSVTTGVGSTSESVTESNAGGENHGTAGGLGHHFTYGTIRSDQFSATTTTTTAATADDPNRPAIDVEAHRAGGRSGRAVANGTIKFGLQIPWPVKKQVGDIDLGWLWEKPSLDESPETMSEGEKACERLVDLFETKGPDPNQVRQRVEALRQVRAQRQAQLREAQRQLRAIITPDQEPKLILMGYLD